MKSRILTVLIGALAVHAACATPITIDLGPDRIIRGTERGQFVWFPFDDLAGTAVAGQTLSLDIDFGDSFIHAFPITYRWFSLWVEVRTDYTFAPGENLSLGLGQVLPLANIEGELDIHGLHFDVTLPDMPGVELLDGHMTAAGGFGWFPYAIGNAKPVPDGGATLGILALAVSCLVYCTKKP